MPVLVFTQSPEGPGIEYVGFVLEEGVLDPPPERMMKVWFPVPVGPRPSHGEDCAICLDETTGLAFDFPCAHMVCWNCAKEWASASGQAHTGLSCPQCRDSSIRPGDYFTGQNQLDAIIIGGFSCAVACAEPAMHLGLSYAQIEVVTDVKTGWWPSLYDSRCAQAPVVQIIAGAEAHREVFTQTMELVHRRCGWCGTSNSPSRCNRCKLVYYCSKNCQMRHWVQHKVNCSR